MSRKTLEYAVARCVTLDIRACTENQLSAI